MENKLFYYSPATCFEEALPLGNGSIGAMVYGKTDKERISLNHDTLWSGKPRTVKRENAYSAYLKAQELTLSGDPAEAARVLERDLTADFSQTYMPLGNLYVESLAKGEVCDYYRELDLEKAIVSVRYKVGDVAFEREYFISHPDSCISVKFSSSEPSDYLFTADSLLKSGVSAYQNKIYLTGEAPSNMPATDYKQTTPIIYDGSGTKFAAVGAVSTDGDISFEHARLKVSNATEVILSVAVKTSFVSFDKLPDAEYYYACEGHADKISALPYPLLKERHISDHSSLYSRMSLDLGFKTSKVPTDERIKAENKEEDLGLIELLFNYGRYLVIASSREGSEATNLQGIWNEKFFPAWQSNYTVNINTEMNYWPVLTCGLAGLDMPIIELIKKISVTGAETAKSFYSADGYCAHHNVDIWGHSTPVGLGRKNSVQWAFWNMSAGWLCRHLWEHYEYTLDVDFLKNTAYPLMRGAAEFYLSILIKHNDRYVISPTTSPENSYYTENGERVFLAKSTAMTQAIITDLFTNVIKAADKLSIDDEFTCQVKEKLPYLCTYKIGSEGQLLEYDEEYKEFDRKHRHTSHLYGLYPGEEITLERTPDLANACKKTLEIRGDVSSGWAMSWRVCLWAKLKDGDHALTLLKNQLRPAASGERSVWSGSGSYANLFDAHPPFQIDGNFGACAGIALMLLQCEDGKLRILPALPREFKNGSVKGLKAKGDITVSIEWKDGHLSSLSLQTPHAQSVVISTEYGETKADLESDKPFSLSINND